MEASSRHVPVRLERETRCKSCGERLVAGDLAAIVAVSDTIVCPACAVFPPEGGAGVSAQREYDRRRQRRRDRARDKLGLVGTVLAHVIEEPQSTKSWAQGAQGKRRTAERLEKHLAGHPVKLLHDRRIPSPGKANLDHLAVGPGGVTVIDSETHRGEVRVERVGGLFADRHSILKIAGRDQTKLIDGVERQVKLVANNYAWCAGESSERRPGQRKTLGERSPGRLNQLLSGPRRRSAPASPTLTRPARRAP